MEAKLHELEAQLVALRSSPHQVLPATSAGEQRHLTGVFGNLDGFNSLTSATTWLKEQLQACSSPQPHNIYAKGGFSNIVFAEFGCTADRDSAVALIRNAALQRDGKQVWATQDRPPSARAARNLCFGIKYLLKTKFDISYTIRVVDEEPYTVHVGGKWVLTVEISENTLVPKWSEEWQAWKELQDSPELQDVVDKCQGILERSLRGMKGTGKGSK